MATNKEILFKFINDQSQKVQSDISQQGYKRNSPYVDRQQNIIQGQPGQPTPITMRGVDKTLLGTDEYGNQQIMHPGQEYEFPGSQVTEREIPVAQYGGHQTARDSVAHQVDKILQYEQLRGGPGGTPLPYYNDPTYKNMLMNSIYPEVQKIMPNASAMESGEAMDFVFNAGWDKNNNKITKDPRAFALQEYYKKYDSSKLDKDGKWIGRKNAPYSFDQEYDNTIAKLPENQRRILMNKGRDWYYQNINNPTPGVPSSDYNDTWYGRIHNTNDYKPFDPNNPKFTPKKQNGGSLLTKTIKCSNCGWSWKAADGGNDVSTCHKCGEEVLIQAQLGTEVQEEPIISGGNLEEVIVQGNPLSEFGKTRKQVAENNSWENYAQKYLGNFEKNMGQTINNLPEYRKQEYEDYINKVSFDEYVKTHPQFKGEKRGAYIDRMQSENANSSNFEKAYNANAPYNDATDVNKWRKGLMGIGSLVAGAKTINELKQQSDYFSKKEKQHITENPISSEFETTFGTLEPLSIPVESMYGNKSFKDIASGQSADIPMTARILGDPLMVAFEAAPLISQGIKGLRGLSTVGKTVSEESAVSKLGAINEVSPSMPNVFAESVTPIPWQTQDLPGLHLQSTMENGAISKIVEPKTGLINTEQALAIIGKESGGADKVALIKQGLGETIPKKIDYNQFRKVVQDQLIPLESNLAEHSSNYGLGSLGYRSPKRSSFEMAINNSTRDIESITNRIKEAELKKPDFDFESGVPLFEQQVDHDEYITELYQRLGEAKTQLERNLEGIKNIPLENKTLIFGNKNKFGRGSSAHNNPKETLGHAHYLIDSETPDVLTVTQLQSDAFQGTHRMMPKNLEDAMMKLDVVKGDTKEAYKVFGDESEKFKDVLNNADEYLTLEENHIKNFNQKSLLDKNHQERYLQEIVNNAAQRGDINKIRLPTSDTAAKVQNYTSISNNTIGPETKKILDNSSSFDEFLKVKYNEADGYNFNNEELKSLEKIFNDYKSNTLRPTYEPQHQTILKKYSEQPKLIKKLFGEEPAIVTDSKGNTWYEFDIPKKYKEGKGEIKAFQIGGENQESVEWTKKYVSSPKYKERITNSGYDNPDKQIDKRLQNLENVNIVDTNNPQGTVYKPSRNTIETSYPADLEYYNIHKNLYPTRPNLDSIVAHELGHSETNRQNSTASLLNKYDRGQLKDRLVPEAYDDLQVYIDNYLKHDKSHHNVIPEENKSDLNSYRYDIRNQYDAGTQDFTKEHLQNSPSSFAKERLLKNYSDEDLIWLMNNIAQNNNNETQIPTAQYGGSRFIPKDERDNSRVSVDNTRVNNFNDSRLFSKTARNKTQKEIDKEIIDDRNKRIDASIVANKKGNLFTDNDWRQQLADRTQATGDKFRIFPNDANSFIDDYINPGVFIGNMASGLGSAPLRAHQEDSYMPYVTSVAEPVAMGAVGKILEPYINKASKFVKGQIKKNVAIPIAKSIVNKVDDAAMQEALIKFTNNPNVSSKNIIKSESFKPTELTNADGTPVPGAKSRFIAGIAEAAEPLDNEVKKRIQELSSPEGYKRLVDQESKYLRNIGFEGDLNAQADINATARLNEMHNYTSPNKVAAEMRSFNKIGDETNIEQWSNNSNMFDNAYYQPPGLAEFADVYTLPRENPYVFNQHTPTGTINIQKPPPQLGGKIMPGEIGIGYDYKNSVPTMRHEIGHFNSRGRVMPIDIEARSLETKQFLTPNEEAQYKYFRTGSKGKEPTGFLNEARQSMLDNKLINNIYDDITPEIVQKAHTHFTNAPSYEFRLPKNAIPGEEHFTSPHRIFDFMNASPENFAKLSTLFNKLPAAVPVTVAGSALGAGALQQQQFGGTTVAEQYTQITGKPWRTAHTEGLTDGTAQQNLALIERLKQQLQPLQEPVVQEEKIQIVEEPVQPAMFNEDQLHRKDLAKRVVEIAENRIKNNKYIDVPDDLVKIALSRGEFANSCIGGVCDVFKEAGVMKSVDWSNTHFAKNAKEYGFTANNGWGIKSIGNLEPGDMLQRNNHANKDGVYYPGHSQIYLGKDANGKYRFFDNYNKEERTYYEDDIKNLLDPARKKTEPSASIYKVNPYTNDNPYSLTPEEQIRAVEKSKMIKSESTSPASYNWKIADNAKNYNADTKVVMDKFIDFANNNDKINELVKKTGKSKEEINDSLLNVFGEFGQENNWTTSKGKGISSRLENIGESILTAFGIGKNLSVGPGQIKFNQIPADVRKSFNINSPNDLYDIEKVLPLMTALDLKDKEVLTNWGKNDTLSSKLFGWKRDKYEDGYGNVTSGGFTADELSADTDGSRLNNSVGRYSPYLRNQYSSIANNTVTTGQNDYIPFNENTQQNYVPGRFNSGNEDTMIQSYTRDPGSYPYKVESNWRNNLERNVIKNEEGAVELPEIVVGKRKLKKEMGGLLYNDKDNTLPHNESIDKYLAPEQTLINFMTKMQKENGGSVPFGEYYNANIKNPRKKS